MRLWIPALSMMLVSLISYVDRHTLALLAPTILRDTGLSAEQYGWIISAFSVAYMIGNPVWGRVLDRYGLRAGMIAAVSFWTLASVAHAFASGLPGFAASRAALGFGEGATFPGGLRTVVQTLPAAAQARGTALSYSGGSLGAVVTPFLMTPVAAHWGWRGAFWFTGLIGALWIALWLVVSRRPEIASYRPTACVDAGAPRPGFGDLRLWSFLASYALGALPLAFILYGTSVYLAKVFGKTQTDIGAVLWIPPLGWEAGYFFWGWLLDRMRTDRLGALRTLLGVCTLFSLPLAAAPHSNSYGLFLLLLFFAMFVAAGFVILPIGYATLVFSRRHAGFLAGLAAGSWSAVVAGVMPLFGRLLDAQQYPAAFGLAACIPWVGFGFWWTVNRRGATLGN